METVRPLLIRGLEEIGLDPSDLTVSRFVVYLGELKRWSRAYNLTGLRSEEEIVTKHFIDSLLYLRMIPPDCRDLGDIGSGAGFPGVPLALVRPGLRVTLIEPSRKKCAFLRHLVRELSLENVVVIEGRVEEVDQLFDVVVTRALFTIGDLLKKTRSRLREGGFIIVSKGPGFRQEIRGLPEGIGVEVEEVGLPGTPLKRFLVKVVPGPPVVAGGDGRAVETDQ